MLLSLLVAAMATAAAAESLTWAVFALGSAGRRQAVAHGVRIYSPARDIVVQEHAVGGRGTVWWSKSLLLNDTFALSASVYRHPKLEGFGLSIKGPDAGKAFSWEWFELQKDNVFQKLQGRGRLSVMISKGADYEELRSVEFLDDIVLRYLDDISKPPGTHTHEVLVRKGSVFKLAP
jgi:hypothetical protein